MTRFAIRSLSLCLGLCLSAAVMAGETHPSFDYAKQSAWPAVLDHAQSPINVITSSALPADGKDSAALMISAGHALSRVEDNGHAVQVSPDNVEAMIRGRHFRLAQFHFHNESEHTLDGKAFPLEGHFVFRAQDGRLAVIAVMYQTGAANPAIEPVLADLRHPGHQPVEIDIPSLLPANMSYYHYLGSLTTPPLTENVEWYVLDHPMTLSASELSAMQALHSHNNRVQQPMHDRPLIHYAE